MTDTLDGFLTRFSQKTPGALAAVDGDARWDYATLERRVTACAAWLVARGVTPGERVALVAGPGLVYYVALLAVSRIGAIYVGVNPRYTRSEAAHLLTLTRPSVILMDMRIGTTPAQNMREAAGALPLVAVEGPEALPMAEGASAVPGRSGADTAVIVFTSGSTGQPKGAALHHSGLIAAAQAQSRLSDVWPDGAQPRYLSNLPINHVGGIMNLTLAALVAGGALVFQPKFEAAQTLALLRSERITSWLQVPAMFTMCVQHPAFAQTQLPDLRTIGIGGGAVSVKTLAALRGLGADIFVEYGQTETMSSLSWSDKTDPDDVLLNTVGRFDPAIEVRIADEAGRTVPQGDIGEVQARGNCVMRGYWGNPLATRSAFTADGWLHTGDLAQERPDGRIKLVGRLREMIKSGGYNVYPREVEQVLETHPAIAEVVVFAAPDEVYTERVEAAIELRPGAQRPKAEALVTLCRDSLAGYKLPRQIHFSDALPRLPNGKIDRTAVRALFRA